MQGNEKKIIAEMQRLHLPFRYSKSFIPFRICSKRLVLKCNHFNLKFRFFHDTSHDGKLGKLKWNTFNIHQLDTVLHSFKISNVLNSEYDRWNTKIDNLTKAQLVKELKKLGISEKGNKSDVLSRLKEELGPDAMVFMLYFCNLIYFNVFI